MDKLPNGWVYVDRAYKGVFAGSRKNGGSFSVNGPIWVPIPITKAAQQEAAKQYVRTLETPDGEQEVKGVEGGFASFYFQAWESLRSACCDADKEGHDVTREFVQNLVGQMEPLSGKKGGFKKVEASEAEVERLASDPKALMAYLKAQGVKIN